MPCGRPQVDWLIDGRMGAEQGAILTVQPIQPADRRFYEATLFSDEEAVPAPCTARAIAHNTFWIAALICNQVKRIVMGQEVFRRIDFDLDSYMLIVE